MSYRIVIVTGHADVLKPVEQHFKKLNWEVFLTENLKAAITQAANTNADFVLIAADHPSKLVRNLPRMLRKECKARLIGFAEANTRTALNSLSEMHFQHVVQHPLSGAAFEYKIKEIIQSEFRAHEGNVTSAIKAGKLTLVNRTAKVEDLMADLGSIIVPKISLPDQKSKFAELTQRALDECVSSSDLESFEALGINKRFACLFVRSMKFSGFLVAALGKNRVVDAKLMEEIRNHLFQSLRYEGEDLFDSDPIHIELQEVAIEQWALQDARFMAKSIHEAQEIAVAFFENDSPFEASEVETMMKVKVEELDEDVVVQFDLFVFLPLNNRMVKYTHQGRTFEDLQKRRLQLKGVTHLHLHKDSFGAAFHHVVGSKLNQKIRDFQSGALAA